MFDKLEKVLGPLASKLSSNKVLAAIRDGFLVGTPLIIAASIFLVIGNFPIEGYEAFVAKFLGEGWDGYLNAVIRSTFGVIASSSWGYWYWILLCEGKGSRRNFRSSCIISSIPYYKSSIS